MRTLVSPVRPLPLWHLLLIALFLGVLALFCPGRSAAEIRPSSDVLVPYFEVDLSDPQMGATTLFAGVNDSPQAVDVLMILSSNWGIPLLRSTASMSKGLKAPCPTSPRGR